MIRFLLIAFVFIGFGTLDSQDLPFEFSFLGKEDQITIPFSYTQGFIILKATLNGDHKINLILDTGAENIIFFKYEAIDRYNLTKSKEIEMVGSDLEKVVDAVICRRNTLELEEGVAMNNDLVVLKEDILALDQITGQSIDGILGARSFWGQTLSIDYIEEELIISKSTLDLPHKHDLRYQSYPLTLINHKPYLELEYYDHNGDAKPLEVLVDTGSALGLILFTDADSSFTLPPKHIRASLGKGIGGDIKGYIGRLPKIEFSDVHFFKNIVSYFQEISGDIDSESYAKRLGLVGNPILSRFDIVIDYLNNTLYLKTNESYGLEFKHDMSGLLIFASGRNLNDFVVHSVYESSPAEHAGFQKGDVIRRVGLWGANLLSLGNLSNKLSKREGKKLRIVIKRDGKKLVKWITLRDYLSE